MLFDVGVYHIHSTLYTRTLTCIHIHVYISFENGQLKHQVRAPLLVHQSHASELKASWLVSLDLSFSHHSSFPFVFLRVSCPYTNHSTFLFYAFHIASAPIPIKESFGRPSAALSPFFEYSIIRLSIRIQPADGDWRRKLDGSGIDMHVYIEIIYNPLTGDRYITNAHLSVSLQPKIVWWANISLWNIDKILSFARKNDRRLFKTAEPNRSINVHGCYCPI